MEKVKFEDLLKLGIVQEINRQLLHSRGMALTLSFDDNGNAEEMYIVKTEDEAGFYFGDGIMSQEKADSFNQMLNDTCAPRMKKHKYLVQPLPRHIMQTVYVVELEEGMSNKDFTDQLDKKISHQMTNHQQLILTTDDMIPDVLKITGVVSVVVQK